MLHLPQGAQMIQLRSPNCQKPWPSLAHPRHTYTAPGRVTWTVQAQPKSGMHNFMISVCGMNRFPQLSSPLAWIYACSAVGWSAVFICCREIKANTLICIKLSCHKSELLITQENLQHCSLLLYHQWTSLSCFFLKKQSLISTAWPWGKCHIYMDVTVDWFNQTKWWEERMCQLSENSKFGSRWESSIGSLSKFHRLDFDHKYWPYPTFFPYIRHVLPCSVALYLHMWICYTSLTNCPLRRC